MSQHLLGTMRAETCHSPAPIADEANDLRLVVDDEDSLHSSFILGAAGGTSDPGPTRYCGDSLQTWVLPDIAGVWVGGSPWARRCHASMRSSNRRRE